jgi:hypothetical protein
VAKNGDLVALTASFDAQNAEAVVRVVEGHPIHQAGQNLSRVLRRSPVTPDGALHQCSVGFIVGMGNMSAQPSISGRSRSPPPERAGISGQFGIPDNQTADGSDSKSVFQQETPFPNRLTA